MRGKFYKNLAGLSGVCVHLAANEVSILSQHKGGNLSQCYRVPIGFFLMLPLMFYIFPIFVLRNEVSWPIAILSSMIGIGISIYISHKRHVYPFGYIFQYKSMDRRRAKFKEMAPEMYNYFEKNKFVGYIGIVALIIIILSVYLIIAYSNRLPIRFDQGLLSSFLFIFVAFFCGQGIFTLSIYIIYFWQCFKKEKI